MNEPVFRKYVDVKFTPARLELLRVAGAILSEYEDKGHVMTLRQLYYQCVARGYLANQQSNYDRLGAVVSDGRMAGLLSWTAIEDRMRNLRGLHTYPSPGAAVAETAQGYRIDMWENQPNRLEVWIEKEALVGVIEDICHRLRVNFFACRGYNSQSEQWRAGRRFAAYIQRGQRPIVLHLGDHDPSGLDMTRDNQERLSMFAGTPIQVIRLGLNMDQIERLNPPPNPVKTTDSRWEEYSNKYGDECWELDALPPDQISAVIERAVEQFRNENLWQAKLEEESEHRRLLDDVVQSLGDRKEERS